MSTDAMKLSSSHLVFFPLTSIKLNQVLAFNFFFGLLVIQSIHFPVQILLPHINMRSQLSLSFAIALVLGPAVFLCILAYEGAVADNPAPFDDEPAHHDALHNPLVFCSYLGDHNQLQVKMGQCTGNSNQSIYKERNVTIPSNTCIEKRPDQKFQLVRCRVLARNPLNARDEHLPVMENYSDDVCLRNTSDGYQYVTACNWQEDVKIYGVSHLHSDTDPASFQGPYDNVDLLPREYEQLPQHLLERAGPGNDSTSPEAPETPEKRTEKKSCTKGFCDWAESTAKIERRCYDSNPATPPIPDHALKYTAPFECNICLEDHKFHPDTEHIDRHCSLVTENEVLLLKILAGVLGGILLFTIILATWMAYIRRRNRFSQLNETYSRRSGTHSSDIIVLPRYDGTNDQDIIFRSWTASQRDAPAITVASPPTSVRKRVPSDRQLVMQPAAPKGVGA